MKKIVSFVLTLLLLLSLCACGQDKPQDTTPDTQVPTCSHSWTDANCTTPKTCTKCSATEGEAAGHNYKEGICTACGITDPNIPFTGNTWTAYMVRPSGYTDGEVGEVLSTYSLMATDFAGYAHKDYYSNANYQGEPFGSITYNSKTYYDFWFSSNMNGIEWDDQGDTVTVTFAYDDPVITLVLQRTGEAQFTVATSSDAETIPVGTVFEALQED